MASEEKSHEEGDNQEASFEELYESSLRELKTGEVTKGTIVDIVGDAAIVDIGYKSEGQIQLDELRDKEGGPPVSVGDEISVLLVRLEDEHGYVVLSKRRADQMKVWDDLEKSFEDGCVIEGRITQRVKGGFHVDLSGITAFLPNSQVDLRPVRAPEKLIGTVYEFKVLKYSKPKNNVVVSRRVLLEDERAKLREETLKKIEEGALI